MDLPEKAKRAPSAPVWNQSFPSLYGYSSSKNCIFGGRSGSLSPPIFSSRTAHIHHVVVCDYLSDVTASTVSALRARRRPTTPTSGFRWCIAARWRSTPWRRPPTPLRPRPRPRWLTSHVTSTPLRRPMSPSLTISRMGSRPKAPPLRVKLGLLTIKN